MWSLFEFWILNFEFRISAWLLSILSTLSREQNTYRKLFWAEFPLTTRDRLNNHCFRDEHQTVETEKIVLQEPSSCLWQIISHFLKHWISQIFYIKLSTMMRGSQRDVQLLDRWSGSTRIDFTRFTYFWRVLFTFRFLEKKLYFKFHATCNRLKAIPCLRSQRNKYYYYNYYTSND